MPTTSESGGWGSRTAISLTQQYYTGSSRADLGSVLNVVIRTHVKRCSLLNFILTRVVGNTCILIAWCLVARIFYPWLFFFLLRQGISLCRPGYPELMILLPQPPSCWNDRWIAPHTDKSYFGEIAEKNQRWYDWLFCPLKRLPKSWM